MFERDPEKLREASFKFNADNADLCSDQWSQFYRLGLDRNGHKLSSPRNLNEAFLQLNSPSNAIFYLQARHNYVT